MTAQPHNGFVFHIVVVEFAVNENKALTLIGLGFLTCLGLGGGGGGGSYRPLLSSLFVDLSQRNFVQGLTIKALAQMWKKFA